MNGGSFGLSPRARVAPDGVMSLPVITKLLSRKMMFLHENWNGYIMAGVHDTLKGFHRRKVLLFSGVGVISRACFPAMQLYGAGLD